MGFSLPSIKRSAAPPSSGYCRALFRYLNIAQRFDYRTLDSSRKLGGVAEHLIDGSEKHICRLSFECKSPRVIEKRSNDNIYPLLKCGFPLAEESKEAENVFLHTAGVWV